MKIRDSGMPKEELWTEFFDPNKVLELLGVDSTVENVADFGCGYGTFTIPAARIIAGKIYAFDIEPEMIKATERKAKALSLGNVDVILRGSCPKVQDLRMGVLIMFFFLISSILKNRNQC